MNVVSGLLELTKIVCSNSAGLEYVVSNRLQASVIEITSLRRSFWIGRVAYGSQSFWKPLQSPYLRTGTFRTPELS